jgi:hypothetical protein
MTIIGDSTRTVEARNRSLPQWFTQIRSGQLRLPRFQRYESWSHNNIGNLLENVVRGLPSGATLVLEVGDAEQFVSRPVAGAPEHPFKPNEHLLDGQQMTNCPLAELSRRLRRPDLLGLLRQRRERRTPNLRPTEMGVWGCSTSNLGR